MEDGHDRLVVIHGSNIGQEYILAGDTISLGRGTNNDIILPFPEVSRRHAHIWKDETSVYLEDLGSTNGTFVNTVRLQEPVKIFHGDEVQIGDTLRFLYSSSEGSVRPAALEDTYQTIEPGLASPPAAAQPVGLPVPEIKTPQQPLYPNAPEPEPIAYQAESANSGRRMILTCGCIPLVLISICFITLLFLDSYQGGRLLYCGGLGPFFELLLGPLGYSPICP